MSSSNISFVIPAYNAASTLKAAVDSIFAGNFTSGDEVIIVNDAATDPTALVAQKLLTTYNPHITVFTNQINRGCPASRNVGIKAAKNQLIFNLDADNILAANSITKLHAVQNETGADVVAFAEYRYFITSPKRITHYWKCIPGWFNLANLFAGHINPGPGGNFLYTKASWERIGGYWEYGRGLHEAWGFTLKQLASGNTMYVVPDTYYFHRHGHESLFVSESKNKAGETALVHQMIAPYQNIFAPSSFELLQSDTNWYRALDSHPLKLNSEPLGKNGTLVITGYGRLFSIKRKVISLFT